MQEGQSGGETGISRPDGQERDNAYQHLLCGFDYRRAGSHADSGGGKPSGPLSFMRVYDQVAAVVKSGGKTRRAAKMQ